jgi:hypothetical protein
MYTLCGNPVNSLHDFGDEEVFIAYGVDKCTADDFDLDLIEFRNVQVPYVLSCQLRRTPFMHCQK